MAVVSEASFIFDGTVRRVWFERSQQGDEYLRAQVENLDGISDISFSADDTKIMRDRVEVGERVAWIVRPRVYSGVSQKTNRPYGILSLFFLRPAAAATA